MADVVAVATCLETAARESRIASTKTPIAAADEIIPKTMASHVASTSAEIPAEGIATAAWDLQAASVDQRQAELSHLQWSLFREQMSAFSNEAVAMRGELQTLRLAEAQLGQAARAEAAERSELAARLEMSIKAVAEGLDAMAVDVKVEVAGHRKLEDQFTHNFRAIEQRLNEMAQRLREQEGIWSRSLESEAADRADSNSRICAELSELRRMLSVERSRRECERQLLEEQIGELRLGLKEAGFAPGGMEDASDAVSRIQEIGVHKFLFELKQEIDEKIKYRASAGLAQERSLEEMVASLRAELASEAASRKRDIDSLGNATQVVQQELRGLIEEETQKRNIANESLVQSNNSILQAMEMEQQERVRGSKNTLMAMEMGSRAVEAMKKSFAQEAMLHSSSIAELRADMDSARQHINNQASKLHQTIHDFSVCVYKGDERLTRTLTEFRTKLEQDSHRWSGDESPLNLAIRDTSEKLSLLNLQANERASGFEESVRAVERTEKATQEHGVSICELRTSVDAAHRHINSEILTLHESIGELAKLVPKSLGEREPSLSQLASPTIDATPSVSASPPKGEQSPLCPTSADQTSAAGFDDSQVSPLTQVSPATLGPPESKGGCQHSGDDTMRIGTLEELLEVTRRFEAEKHARLLGQEGMRHLIDSCREELVTERKARTSDYAALRGGLECLDRQTEREMATLRRSIEAERDERLSAVRWLEQRERMGELYCSLNPGRDRFPSGSPGDSVLARQSPVTPPPARKRS